MARQPYKPDVVLGHAEDNDGIEEYDNKLPNWWLGLFYATIAIGVWIFLQWHVFGSRSLAEQYQTEMAEATARYAGLMPQPPTEVPLTSEASAAGAALFHLNCVPCHGEDATGRVGPNLTDAVWIHGGTPLEIANTIFNGVPDRGMITWGPILGAEHVSQLAAYVHGLGGGVPVDGSGAGDGSGARDGTGAQQGSPTVTPAGFAEGSGATQLPPEQGVSPP